jgi:putative Mn2+ efflux pump MntP
MSCAYKNIEKDLMGVSLSLFILSHSSNHALLLLLALSAITTSIDVTVVGVILAFINVNILITASAIDFAKYSM